MSPERVRTKALRVELRAPLHVPRSQVSYDRFQRTFAGTPEVFEQTPIRVRRRVVELVDHDVREVVGREALQMLRLAQRLDRCEQHGRLAILLDPGELAMTLPGRVRR